MENTVTMALEDYNKLMKELELLREIVDESTTANEHGWNGKDKFIEDEKNDCEEARLDTSSEFSKRATKYIIDRFYDNNPFVSTRRWKVTINNCPSFYLEKK